MPLRRKLYQQLVTWKQTSQGRTAILLDGPRRVGKSYLAEQFARRYYRSHLILDCSVISDDVKNIFVNYLDRLDDFFFYLSNYYNVKFYPRETLLIFDEIQRFPRAREAIKQLVADCRYDYLETGSLISIKKNVQDIVIPSEERHLDVRPLDFEEFLWALDRDNLMNLVRHHYQARTPLPEALHRQLMDFFRQYLIVGGMPQVINAYLEERDFGAVDEQKRIILRLYRDDIRKFAHNVSLKVEQIFDEIPAQLQKHEKKFNLAALDVNARYREYYGAFYWLEDAGLINLAYNATEPNLGLRLRLDSNSCKCYFADTGLLLSLAFDERGLTDQKIYQKILFDKLSFNQGMLLENMVAQMLTAQGHQLYFFSRHQRDDASQTMEIDFLIAKSQITSRHNITPIEVKSGKNYTHTSLDKFQRQYRDYLDKPVVIHTGNFHEDQRLIQLPIYMTPLL